MRTSISIASVVFGFILVAACGGTASEGGGGGDDRDAATEDGGGGDTSTADGDAGDGPACAITYDELNDSPKVNARSTHAWTCTATSRIMTGNGIPDHAVVGGNFATAVGVQSLSVTFPLAPAAAAAPTTLVRTPSGYALNSVKLDPGTDGSCASSATSTAPGNGCVAIMGRDPWRLEAIGGAFKFGTDENNAHTQPNGQYHYHGMPEGMLAKAGSSVTLVGFAVDGFPIYARYGYSVATDAGSAIKVVTGSWQLKATPDAGRPDTTVFPMGTFTSDYEYVAGSGDLDECNGRTGVTPEFPQGTYHYYITDSYPFIQRCVKGSAP
jgi:hypothetical protein